MLPGQSVHLSVPAFDSSNNSVPIGTAYFSWGPFTGNNGLTVQGGQLTRPITNGTIDVTLTASDTAGYVYTLLVMRGSTANTFLWRVPAAGASTMAQLNQPSSSTAAASTPPKWVLAYSSGTQTVPGSFSVYSVLFDTNDPNTNDGSMHSTSSHPERFIAPADGFYHLAHASFGVLTRRREELLGGAARSQVGVGLRGFRHSGACRLSHVTVRWSGHSIVAAAQLTGHGDGAG